MERLVRAKQNASPPVTCVIDWAGGSKFPHF
jgi:hypothetical protein